MWITAITCICIHSDSTDYQACLHSCVPHTCPRLFFKSICIFVTFLLPWSSSSSRSWQIGSAKRLGGSSRLFWQWPQFISGALPPLSYHSLIYNFTSNEIATKNTEKWGEIWLDRFIMLFCVWYRVYSSVLISAFGLQWNIFQLHWFAISLFLIITRCWCQR